VADSVFRSGRKKGFAVVLRDIAQDQRLSLKARGLILLMASLPENWEYTISGLARKAGTGKDQIRSGLKELLDVGYLVKEQSHGTDGKFSKNVFVLQDEAAPLSGNPTTGNPTTEKPSTGNPTQNNKDKNNKDLKSPLPPADVMKRIAEYADGDVGLADAVLGLCLNRHEALGAKKAVKTVRTIDGILRDLNTHSGGDRRVKLLMLDKAVKNNWLTVYALKPDELPTPVVPDAARVEEQEGVTFF